MHLYVGVCVSRVLLCVLLCVLVLLSVCIFPCVCERGREREIDIDRERERERERETDDLMHYERHVLIALPLEWWVCTPPGLIQG